MKLAINYRRVDPARGGAETYVADLCRQLVEAGHEVDLYAESWAPDALPGEVRRVRVAAEGLTRAGKIWSFAVNSEAALRAASHDCTVGFINTWHHDVLIPQGGVHAASLDANAGRFPEGWRRSLYKLAKAVNPKAPLYRAIERRQYDPRRGARVVAVSEMVRGHLRRYQGVPPDRVDVIPNAIDADRLALDDPAAARREFRSKHGLDESRLVALFVGHNFRLKGLGPLLEALSLRRRRAPDGRPVHLLVVGGGNLDPYRGEVRRLGLDGSVKLIGFVDDVRTCYHASDFFVLPTYYDPCSLVVFEALACGLPVVTTAQNGAGELIAEGVQGFVVPSPGRVDALADAIDALCDDGRRARMSAASARLGREQSLSNHVARLVEVFRQVAATKRSLTPHARPTPRLVD